MNILTSTRTRDTLLTELRNLQPHLRLLITSRPNVKHLALKFDNVLQLEIRASDSDIKRYLESEIDKERKTESHFKTNPSLRDLLINIILQKAEGMSVSMPSAISDINHY